MIRYIEAHTKDYISTVHELFLEYASVLRFNLCFQDFDKELADLPGDYTPPEGRLYLVYDNDQVAGCIALRKFSEAVCEMKRMYVRPVFRGKGIGKGLGLMIIEEAKKIGYKAMRLDTLPSMQGAISIYRSLGFKEIEPYRYNPVEGAIFMELDLSDE